MVRCKNCGTEVESDGHGELIHVTEDDRPGAYGCNPKAKANQPYPVAE